MMRPPPRSPLFPYTTLSRSLLSNLESNRHKLMQLVLFGQPELDATLAKPSLRQLCDRITHAFRMRPLSEPEVAKYVSRSEEHTSELQSLAYLVCRLLLEKKK